MKRVKVYPGPCGFESTIEAESDGNYQVRMSVESECPAVTALGKRLANLTMKDVVGKEGFGHLRPFEEAADTLFHASCPVLTAFLKAAEAEMGLAVAQDVTIEFIEE